MSLNLDKNQLSKILEREEFKIRITKSRLLEIFSKTYHRTVKIFNQIIDNYDKNGLEKSLNGEDINPILWQCGHIVYFYKKHCGDFFNLQVTHDLERYIIFYDLNYYFNNKRFFLKKARPKLEPSTGILCSQFLKILVLILIP